MNYFKIHIHFILLVDFRYLQPNQLDTFIAQYLQPDEAFHNTVSSVLDILCRYLQNEMRPNVRRIVKVRELNWMKLSILLIQYGMPFHFVLTYHILIFVLSS
jgi:hypothetical protein